MYSLFPTKSHLGIYWLMVIFLYFSLKTNEASKLYLTQSRNYYLSLSASSLDKDIIHLIHLTSTSILLVFFSRLYIPRMNNISASSSLLKHLFIYSAIHSFRVRFCKNSRTQRPRTVSLYWKYSWHLSIESILNTGTGLDFFELDLRVSDTWVLIIYVTHTPLVFIIDPTVELFLHSHI